MSKEKYAIHNDLPLNWNVEWRDAIIAFYKEFKGKGEDIPKESVTAFLEGLSSVQSKAQEYLDRLEKKTLEIEAYLDEIKLSSEKCNETAYQYFSKNINSGSESTKDSEEHSRGEAPAEDIKNLDESKSPQEKNSKNKLKNLVKGFIGK